MALFPSVIPWTLVLTQVMTAGLAVVPGRWAHLFRKCLQVQVLCGWERAGDPEVLGYHFLLGLALWEEKKKKKIPLRSSKSWGGKRERSQDQGPQYSFRRALSHAHINIQCQDLHGRVEQVISILVMPYSQLKRLSPRRPWTNSPPHEKEKTHDTARLHCWVEIVLEVLVHIWQLWTLCHCQNMALSVAGEMVSVR